MKNEIFNFRKRKIITDEIYVPSEKGFTPSTQVLFSLPTNAFFSHTKMNKEFSTPLIYKKDACAFCTHCLSCHGLG
jgi:hypothetical protein